MKHKPTLFENPLLSSLAFAASLFLTNFLLEQERLSAPTRLVMAMIPLVAFLYWVWTQAKAYKQADELWQRILLTTWTYALVTSVLGALGLHYLQRAGFFPPAEYPNLDYWGDVLPYAFGVGFLYGFFRAKRRYE